MAVVGATLLLAVGRALARIHVEHDDPRRSPRVHLVDPPARQVGEGSEVLRPHQPLGLEAAHLAGRGSPTHWRLAADHPAHCRVAAQPVGFVHVLIAGQPPEYRLPQQADQQMASVRAGACLRQSLAATCGQCEHVIKFAIRQQSAIGGDRRAVPLPASCLEPADAQCQRRESRSSNARRISSLALAEGNSAFASSSSLAPASASIPDCGYRRPAP